MRITAKAKEKHVDVRDVCADLHLKATRPEDEYVLTRLYRHFAGIEPDPATAEAVKKLHEPTTRFTSHGASIVMTKREGATS